MNLVTIEINFEQQDDDFLLRVHKRKNEELLTLDHRSDQWNEVFIELTILDKILRDRGFVEIGDGSDREFV